MKSSSDPQPPDPQLIEQLREIAAGRHPELTHRTGGPESGASGPGPGAEGPEQRASGPEQGASGPELVEGPKPRRRSTPQTGRQRRRRDRDDEHDQPDRDLGPNADPENVAREIVLRKLTAQARSRGELAKALAEKDVPDDTADAVLDRMEEVGLVDDTEFAESWVRSRQGRRHLSKRALRQELIRKGVDRENIDQALEQVAPDDEYAAAKSLAEKKLRGMTSLEHQVKYRRLAGALARRGFSAGICSQVLNEVLSAEDAD